MKKRPLVNKIFLENRNMLEKIMKENNMSKKDIITEITIYLNNLNKDLYLSNDNIKSFRVKDVDNYLPVKLGWYKPLDKRNIDPEMHIEQFTITPTKKGRAIYEEYKRLNSK